MCNKAKLKAVMKDCNEAYKKIIFFYEDMNDQSSVIDNFEKLMRINESLDALKRHAGLSFPEDIVNELKMLDYKFNILQTYLNIRKLELVKDQKILQRKRYSRYELSLSHRRYTEGYSLGDMFITDKKLPHQLKIINTLIGSFGINNEDEIIDLLLNETLRQNLFQRAVTDYIIPDFQFGRSFFTRNINKDISTHKYFTYKETFLKNGDHRKIEITGYCDVKPKTEYKMVFQYTLLDNKYRESSGVRNPSYYHTFHMKSKDNKNLQLSGLSVSEKVLSVSKGVERRAIDINENKDIALGVYKNSEKHKYRFDDLFLTGLKLSSQDKMVEGSITIDMHKLIQKDGKLWGKSTILDKKYSTEYHIKLININR